MGLETLFPPLPQSICSHKVVPVTGDLPGKVVDPLPFAGCYFHDTGRPVIVDD